MFYLHNNFFKEGGFVYVYQIENIRNRKKYIGVTKNFEQRKSQHINTAFNKNSIQYDNILYKEMREFQVSSFKFTVLCVTESEEIAFLLEDMFIREFDTIIDNGKGYNNNFGGKNGKHSDSTKNKLNTYNFQNDSLNISFNKTGKNALHRRKIINVTDNIVYETIKECAILEYGDKKYSKEICKVCNPNSNRFTYKSKIYRYIDDNGNIIEKNTSPIVNVGSNGVSIIEKKH